MAQETKPHQDVIVSTVELPEYPGGPNEMKAFIEKNIVLPEKCKTDSTFNHCIVFVKFIIAEDGKLINPEIMKGCVGFSECDKEALRILNKMPKWKPAMQDHKAVKRAFSAHITFKKN
jgi:protein TonB